MATKAFFKDSPYADVAEFDPNTGRDLLKIKLVKPMPDVISLIAFDAAQSLRSALDQAGHAVAIAAGTKGKNSYFPFGDTLAEVESRRPTMQGAGPQGSSDIPKEIFDLMVACQPYQAGNVALWALNKICNCQKHRVTIPFAIQGAGMHIHSATMTGFGDILMPRWDRAKNEMIIASIRPGSQFHMDCETTTFVSFAEPNEIFGQPAKTVLDKLANDIEGILSAIELEGRRIGLFN